MPTKDFNLVRRLKEENSVRDHGWERRRLGQQWVRDGIRTVYKKTSGLFTETLFEYDPNNTKPTYTKTSS